MLVLRLGTGVIHTIFLEIYKPPANEPIGSYQIQHLNMINRFFGYVIWISNLWEMHLMLQHFLLRMRAMHKANTALLDVLVDNSVIIPSF